MLSRTIRNTLMTLIAAKEKGEMTDALFFQGMQTLRDCADDVQTMEAITVPCSTRVGWGLPADLGDNVVAFPSCKTGGAP